MALKDILKNKSQAGFVEYGYGQVEPNHLSAQRTGQIYAQLPAAATIDLLEQGQFVKYDYAKGKVTLGAADDKVAEWMLVYNETKLYREEQNDCEFAMIKGDYKARVYSPLKAGTEEDLQLRDYSDIIASADIRELDYTDDPFHVLTSGKKAMMPEDVNSMVPRVFKTNVGDIFTTNTITETSIAVGDLLTPQVGTGILGKTGAATAAMKWQVVKVYTMPDGQQGAKIMRIA